MGEHFLELLEDFTSCGGALLGAFGGFNVVWGSTSWSFCRILRRVGEHCLALLEDFTSCVEALFWTFGGFNVVWGSTFQAEIMDFERNLADFLWIWVVLRMG